MPPFTQMPRDYQATLITETRAGRQEKAKKTNNKQTHTQQQHKTIVKIEENL